MSARWATIFVVAAIGPSAASAADAEIRIFAVQVDGRAAGEFRLIVRTDDDGTETATAAASVQVRQLLGAYRYTFRGSETWKASRLQRLDAISDDNGKKHTVAAVATESNLRVTVDGITRSVRPDVWPTTYWRMPTGMKSGQAIALLDADTGEEISAKLETVGPAKATVLDKPTDCTRITITGPASGMLWYDGRGRLVAQQTTEDGHTTVLSLREIQR
jgi:hypothetical protein